MHCLALPISSQDLIWFHHWINIPICAREFYFKPENKPFMCLDITYHISYIHHISILYPSHIHHISIMYPSHIHHIPIIYPSYIHHYPSSSIIIHHYPSLSIHLCMISDWTSGSQFMIKRKKSTSLPSELRQPFKIGKDPVEVVDDVGMPSKGWLKWKIFSIDIVWGFPQMGVPQ